MNDIPLVARRAESDADCCSDVFGCSDISIVPDPSGGDMKCRETECHMIVST